MQHFYIHVLADRLFLVDGCFLAKVKVCVSWCLVHKQWEMDKWFERKLEGDARVKKKADSLILLFRLRSRLSSKVATYGL